MKITTQLVALVAVLVAGMVGLVLGLAVVAGWSDGAVVGMVSAFGTVAAGLIVAVRNQEKTTETLKEQTEQLNTVVQQTNGLSEEEREAIAAAAADKAAVAVVTAWRRGEIR